MKPRFFATQDDLRRWFVENHQNETELIVGYYKKGSGLPSVDWPQSVDEAICFGWIDGIRRSIDEKSYQIRFTPRNPRSHWSGVNIRKVEKLIKEKKMYPAGLKVWEAHKRKNEMNASYEQKALTLDKKYEDQIKANPQAWAYFSEGLSPFFRKLSIHWVMSARKEETRQRRLHTLIEASAKGKKISQFQETKR